jgi:putative membrane protein
MKLSTLIITSAFIAGSMAVHAGDVDRKKDSEALGWLIVVDQGEIDMGKAAKARKLDPQVIEFAELMIEDHSKNLSKTKAVAKKLHIEPSKNDDAKKLEENGKEKLKDLSKEDDNKFQKEYVDEMVKGHKDALDGVEDKEKDVSKDLKEHFTQSKAHVAKHLDKAKELQKKLDKKD